MLRIAQPGCYPRCSAADTGTRAHLRSSAVSAAGGGGAAASACGGGSVGAGSSGSGSSWRRTRSEVHEVTVLYTLSDAPPFQS